MVSQGGIYIFYNNFLFLKNKSGLSLRKISEITEIPLRTLEDISRNKTKHPSINTANELAKFFNVSLDELINKDLTS